MKYIISIAITIIILTALFLCSPLVADDISYDGGYGYGYHTGK